MRALVVDPEVLFLDEPFSALDYEMTLFMRDQLQAVFHETRTTTILVSHDLEEAVYLADQVILLTRRPTRIAEVVPFAAPRPRRPETLTSDAFVHAKARCLEVFQREVRK
jgi:NitT/TauT family transport system ATP-binding protein